jgi:hypothetical protein
MPSVEWDHVSYWRSAHTALTLRGNASMFDQVWSGLIEVCQYVELLPCHHHYLYNCGREMAAWVCVCTLNIYSYIFNRSVYIGLIWRGISWADTLWRVWYKLKLPDFRQTCESVWRQWSAVKILCTFRCVVHTVNSKEELMELVRCRPLLYDPSKREYRN